jgi:hypothetical protein
MSAKQPMPIIVAGDPLTGFAFIGPFDTPAEATAWATDHCDQTWVLTYTTPAEDYES